MAEPDLDQRHASLFVLRLAHALHASGYAAHSLEDLLVRVCERQGLIGLRAIRVRPLSPRRLRVHSARDARSPVPTSSGNAATDVNKICVNL